MAGPHISDHALIRLLERAGGYDMETLRARMERALSRAHAAARSISDSDYLIRVDGHTFVVRGDTVTTVLDDNTPPKARCRALDPERGRQ